MFTTVAYDRRGHAFCGHCGGRMFSGFTDGSHDDARELRCLACGRSADPPSNLTLADPPPPAPEVEPAW